MEIGVVTDAIAASTNDTVILWDLNSTYRVYQVQSNHFILLDSFEHYPTFTLAHAQAIADSWFNDSFGLEGE